LLSDEVIDTHTVHMILACQHYAQSGSEFTVQLLLSLQAY